MAEAPTSRSTGQKWVPDLHLHTVLYHGCLRRDVDTMLGGKIDPTLGQPDTDFGRGFYTTTILHQAKDWAFFKRKPTARRTGNTSESRPVVIWFKVPRVRLARLDSLTFSRGDYDAYEYWSFVRHCRSSVPASSGKHAVVNHHCRDNSGRPTWYDVVSGPVSAFWQQRSAMMTSDQFSFHTARGAKVLNDLLLNGSIGKDYGIITVPKR